MFDTHPIIKTLFIFLLSCLWIIVYYFCIKQKKKLIEMFYSGPIDYPAFDTMAPKGCTPSNSHGSHTHACDVCATGQIRSLNPSILI